MKRKVKQNTNETTKTSNLSKLLYICLCMQIFFTQAVVGWVLPLPSCMLYTRHFGDMYFVLMSVATSFRSFHSLHSLCAYVCMLFFGNFMNKFLLLPSNGADFNLQFQHRLQCSTKFQCEINKNNRTQQAVKPRGKNVRKQTALASM